MVVHAYNLRKREAEAGREFEALFSVCTQTHVNMGGGLGM